MSDNVTFKHDARATPPDKTVVATDDVSGAQYQKIKLDVGGDGASVPLESDGAGTFAYTALQAARAGDAFCLKGTDDTLSAGVVQAAAGEYKAVASGERVVVTCFYLHVNTASDWVEMELGSTANADGTGLFTALSPPLRIDTGTAPSGAIPAIIQISPPVIVTTGAFAVKLTANDDAAECHWAANGWTEEAF